MGRRKQDNTEKDEVLAIPLDPETALRALLKVDPDSEPVHNSPQTPSSEEEEPQPGPGRE